MEFKDYYATLGVERSATQEEIKRSYRKLARKFHPDVSKEPDAEERFKAVAEAYKALGDSERRAAYDSVGSGHQGNQEFHPPPGWDSGFEFSGADAGFGGEQSEFFESLFGRHAGAGRRAQAPQHANGADHHAKVRISLADSYRGATRSITLQVPQADAAGHLTLQSRQLEVNIPKGIRDGQHLRLAGQGSPGTGRGMAGDLYLEIAFAPDPHFRVEGRDVYLDLPVAPWEAALGAAMAVATPDGSVELRVPPASSPGRKLRLKGKGLPGNPSGDLYAVLSIALPPADTDAAKAAYAELAKACGSFDPRHSMKEAPGV